jgi:beta-galactosidase
MTVTVKINVHSPEVEKADFTNFCIDKAQAGLACVNSWGAIPWKNYRLPYQDYELSFILTPCISIK